MAQPVPRGAFDVLGLNEIAAGNRFDLENICRAQAQPMFLGDHTGLCRVLGRLKLFVDTRDRGFAANILLDGFWEMWLTMVMARVLKPGMTAIDVGANFGYYSLLMGDLVGPSGRLVAVEPNPAARTLLRQSLLLNGLTARTSVIEAAASSTSVGTAQLYIPASEPKNAFLVGDPGAFDLRDGRMVEVPLWALDDASPALGRVDLIKIDAEGAEQAILAGMHETLRRDRPMLVLEYNPSRYADPAGLLAQLASIYGHFHAISVEGTLLPVEPATILADSSGEDWLLFFSLDPSAALPLPKNKKRRALR